MSATKTPTDAAKALYGPAAEIIDAYQSALARCGELERQLAEARAPVTSTGQAEAWDQLIAGLCAIAADIREDRTEAAEAIDEAVGLARQLREAVSQ